MTSTHDDFLFEVSWEVCNKVGGIYTVVSSKARTAVASYGDNYYLLGPDLKSNAEFEETDEESWQPIREALATKELSCRFGRWQIPGRPKVILVRFAGKYDKAQILYEMWETYGVDSISGGWDYIEPVLFSYACGEAIEAIFNRIVKPRDGRGVAQFHEWMCGAGLLGLKKHAPEVGTVFTTHATILGRTLAGSGMDIYTELDQISPQREAAAHNIVAKHSMEAASAREADCFTTVSDITATEARSLLGRPADVILPNGLDMETIPDLAQRREPALQSRRKLIDVASRFLLRDMPPNTRILLISGRYEFHNKGIDVFLEALGRLQKDLEGTPHHVLAYLLVLGGHEGVNAAALQSDTPRPEGGRGLITCHKLYNEGSDPILNACNRLGLVNRTGAQVNVIFDPAFLNGYDGLLNVPYYEALAGCDLGVFPSRYEPWGYTPLESAAYAVPTITTDLAGFGLWALKVRGEKDGVSVLRRHGRDMQSVVSDLHAMLRGFVLATEAEVQQKRLSVRDLAAGASWSHFFDFYRRAYDFALDVARQRQSRLASAEFRKEQPYTFAGSASALPHFRNFTAVSNLPPSLARLRELAYNLWWSWNAGALDLFSHLDPRLWSRMRGNPVRMLETVPPGKLAEMAENEEYLDLYRRTMEQFDAYMSEKRTRGSATERIKAAAPVAYFSTEYGLHECLPIYSGGLGVLSGDHLKAASDLAVPIVGVGLLYKNGYFSQKIDRNGWQVAEYPENDFSNMPVQVLQDERGQDVEVSIDLPGRVLFARVWLVNVGRIPLYLLDTDVPKNTPQDRRITARLYVADRRVRFEQEILLGMGGVRLLKRLGVTPSVYHVNEGHSAFLTLQRIQSLMAEDGLSFSEAREVVRSSTVFTTHTPVDAGNERFTKDIIEYYFSAFVERTGITWSEFWELGRKEIGDDKPFYMTVLGLRLSNISNAVSRMHATVARHMWQDLWKGFHHTQVPIQYVTNGVHVMSTLAPAMHTLLSRYLGLNWYRNLGDADIWKRVNDIPDSQLWTVKCQLKQQLITHLRENVSRHWMKYGDSRTWREEVLGRLNPAALVIGFARRFAPYKRADLILSDLERLDRIVNNEKRPVHILFAGKAHPEDRAGIELIKRVIDVCNEPRFRGRLFMLEDYDISVARLLVQGTDVWLNTPRRPYEASGTSGQKVLINAGINLSVSDGWWCEAYDGTNGWTIGPAIEDAAQAARLADDTDAQDLYALLEDQVVPLFYDRDDSGMPRKWIAMAKRSMQTLVPAFNAHRMLQEYGDKIYAPTAERGAAMSRSKFKLAREIADWKRRTPIRFSSVRLLEVIIEGTLGDTIPVGRPFAIKAHVDPGKLAAEELLVELVIGRTDGHDFIQPPQLVRLDKVERKDGNLIFSGQALIQDNGQHAYGVRVMPYHPDLGDPHETGLTLWG